MFGNASYQQNSMRGGNQVLAPIILPQIGCLASKLVFGPNGLVLGSSMALIPTEMISIFLEGKIHRYDL
jgi:hypothetical protein